MTAIAHPLAPVAPKASAAMFDRLRGAWNNIAVYAWYHPWARADRAGTFARILRWQLSTAFDRTPRDVAWINGAKLRMRKGQAGLTGNLYYGLHEFADMAFFGHFLRADDAFADIGANAGSYTVLAARVAGARVHAVEPATETLPVLEANIAVNAVAELVTVHRVALGREEGELRFTTGRDSVNRFAAPDEADAVTVQVRTADAELGGLGIAAMKVDVEEAEGMVFAASTALLAEPQLRAIEVETLMPGVREAIEGAGFVERWYDPFARRLHSAPVGMRANNHLFIRDEAFVADRLRAAPPLRFGKLAA